MIVLKRLNGSTFAINPDIVQRVEATPDTVVTLVDGARFVVSDPVSAVVDAVRAWRASVIAAAADPASLPAAGCADCRVDAGLDVVDGAAQHHAARPRTDRPDREGHGPVVPLRRRRP